MKLRLYHHPDGARIAYRAAGTGPRLGLLHSVGMTHREWAPLVEHLSDRFRLVMPDLPMHGDSEDGPGHPYSPRWLTEVMAGFCRETLGPQPLVAGHDLGADLLLRAVVSGELQPARMVLMSSRLHAAVARPGLARAWRAVTRLGALPGLDQALSHGAPRVFRPRVADLLSEDPSEAARDLVRHAFSDVAGNASRARAWARFARRWPLSAQGQMLDAYRELDLPVLLLWGEADEMHPIEPAEEALRRLPDADLRTLPDTGFLMAYDDPVGVARELAAFCGGARAAQGRSRSTR